MSSGIPSPNISYLNQKLFSDATQSVKVAKQLVTSLNVEQYHQKVKPDNTLMINLSGLASTRGRRIVNRMGKIT